MKFWIDCVFHLRLYYAFHVITSQFTLIYKKYFACHCIEKRRLTDRKKSDRISRLARLWKRKNENI